MLGDLVLACHSSQPTSLAACKVQVTELVRCSPGLNERAAPGAAVPLEPAHNCGRRPGALLRRARAHPESPSDQSFERCHAIARRRPQACSTWRYLATGASAPPWWATWCAAMARWGAPSSSATPSATATNWRRLWARPCARGRCTATSPSSSVRCEAPIITTLFNQPFVLLGFAITSFGPCHQQLCAG